MAHFFMALSKRRYRRTLTLYRALAFVLLYVVAITGIRQLLAIKAGGGGGGLSQSSVKLGLSAIISPSLSPELWASGGVGPHRVDVAEVSSLLTQSERDDLRALCGRTLWHSLTKAVRPRPDGNTVFVATGDIDDMWIRDSAVQLSIYFPRLDKHPALRRILEGAMRAQAFYIVQDPYANAYSSRWRDVDKLSKADRVIGRGGWVATRNYELDSGAYFLNMMWNYFSTSPAIFGAERFLNETAMFDAAMLLVDTWVVEQDHERRSSYRYSELVRGGMGPVSAYTGMSWSGYRPSDDPQTYSYNIPVNMYAVGALERALTINDRVWQSQRFEAAAAKLATDMRAGIEAHGIVTHEDGSQSYAYEVDGYGGVLSDFDDPNVPSLLSIPLLGYAHYDPAIYANTRQRILSETNPWFFTGPVLSGLGSPHTPPGHVWPLAVMVGALTTDDPGARVSAFRQLLRAQCGNGLMHESVSALDATACTRPWFEWANAMFVVLYEYTFREQCDVAAEVDRLRGIREREGGGRGGADPLYYETLMARVRHGSTCDYFIEVLLYLFQHLGITNKYFVEFGFNSKTYDGGSGANTFSLWKHFGWKGLLLDGENENKAINLHKEMITPDNIVSLFDKYRVPLEPDYVSIDIDSSDLWVFRSLIKGGYRPRVVTVEYNINHPIDSALVQAADAGVPATGFDYTFGAALKAVALVAEEMGYVLVHVVKGLDAVLVRKDLMRGVEVHPLEFWTDCCTNQTLHAVPHPERVGVLLDYSVYQVTGSEDEAKAAARKYLAARPYLMTRPSRPTDLDL